MVSLAPLRTATVPKTASVGCCFRKGAHMSSDLYEAIAKDPLFPVELELLKLRLDATLIVSVGSLHLTM